MTDGSSLTNTFTVVVGSPRQLTLGSTRDQPVVGESVTYTATATSRPELPHAPERAARAIALTTCEAM
jgi:hypothetical protein